MTGNRSQFPISRLASRYVDMTTDGRILSNRNSIQIIEQRIIQLAERIDVDEAPDRVAKLFELWQEYTDAKSHGRSIDESRLESQLDEEFEKIYHDYAAWGQLMGVLDLRRKMVESEVRIAKELNAILTAEAAYELVAQLLAAVLKAVDDPKKVKQIQYEFSRIIGDVSDPAAERFEQDAFGGSGEADLERGGLDREEFLYTGDET